jgi:hypothetical protein
LNKFPLLKCLNFEVNMPVTSHSIGQRPIFSAMVQTLAIETQRQEIYLAAICPRRCVSLWHVFAVRSDHSPTCRGPNPTATSCRSEYRDTTSSLPSSLTIRLIALRSYLDGRLGHSIPLVLRSVTSYSNHQYLTLLTANCDFIAVRALLSITKG